MAVSEFNLNTGQRAERKLLITVAEWMEGSQQEREILGTRTEDSSIEYNPDVETTTDILGINYTDLNRTQPQQDFDPFLVLGGSKLGAKLNDIRRRNAISELDQFTVYIITAFVGTAGAYEAEKHTGIFVFSAKALNSLIPCEALIPLPIRKTGRFASRIASATYFTSFSKACMIVSSPLQRVSCSGSTRAF